MAQLALCTHTKKPSSCLYAFQGTTITTQAANQYLLVKPRVALDALGSNTNDIRQAFDPAHLKVDGQVVLPVIISKLGTHMEPAHSWHRERERERICVRVLVCVCVCVQERLDKAHHNDSSKHTQSTLPLHLLFSKPRGRARRWAGGGAHPRCVKSQGSLLSTRRISAATSSSLLDGVLSALKSPCQAKSQTNHTIASTHLNINARAHNSPIYSCRFWCCHNISRPTHLDKPWFGKVAATKHIEQAARKLAQPFDC